MTDCSLIYLFFFLYTCAILFCEMSSMTKYQHLTVVQQELNMTKYFIYRVVSNKRSPLINAPLTYFQTKLGKMPKFFYGVSL